MKKEENMSRIGMDGGEKQVNNAHGLLKGMAGKGVGGHRE